MKYWVDFSGYACVEANSPEQAEEKMWEAIHNAFDGHKVFDDVWDIDGIEERVEFASPIDVEAFDKEYRGS